MKRLINITCSFSLLFLCGCAKTVQDWSLAGFGVSAEPLYSYQGTDKPPTSGNKGTVWDALMLSQSKCNKFVNGLVATETGTDTSLDLLTTLSSSLATAFTPLATTHALSAAAAVTGGWRTAIDSDVFAKASIANFAQAIQSTYYKDAGDFGTQLLSETGSIDVGAQIARLQTIHAECSLGSAQATIAATLKAGATSETPQQPGKSDAVASTTSHATGAQPLTPGVSQSFVVPGHAVQN